MKQIRTDIVKGGTSRILKFLREKLDDKEIVKTETVQKKETFPHKLQMHSIKALNLAMKELTNVPDEVFEDAKVAEVQTVDLSKNKLHHVPVGYILFKEIKRSSNLFTFCF